MTDHNPFAAQVFLVLLLDPGCHHKIGLGIKKHDLNLAAAAIRRQTFEEALGCDLRDPFDPGNAVINRGFKVERASLPLEEQIFGLFLCTAGHQHDIGTEPSLHVLRSVRETSPDHDAPEKYHRKDGDRREKAHIVKCVALYVPEEISYRHVTASSYIFFLFVFFLIA